MSDSELADIIIERLNHLIQNDSIKSDICKLIENRVLVTEQTAKHPHIQVDQNDAEDNFMGFLGLLNGIVGAIPNGKFNGWGYITASFDEAGDLERFYRAGDL